MFALSQTWMQSVCADLQTSPPGFNISAVDIQGMRNLFGKLQPAALGAIKFYVHGGNYTHDVLSKWGSSKRLTCPNCDAHDSKFHRIFECPAYDAY